MPEIWRADAAVAHGAPAQEPAEELPAFQFAKQWYPLAFLSDLYPKQPHPVELLGQRLVLWRDGRGEWRCFEDKCPHRLAPLSGVVHACG